MNEASFKHGEREALRSCIKALNFWATEICWELQDFTLNKLKGIEDELIINMSAKSSFRILNLLSFCRGELQDFVLNKSKGIEDELIIKLKSAIIEVADGDGDDEYSLLVDLNRLYELQLSRQISIESLHKDLAETLKNFRSIDDENNSGCFREATLASTELEALEYSPDESILQNSSSHLTVVWRNIKRAKTTPHLRKLVIIAVGKLVAADAVPKAAEGARIVGASRIIGVDLNASRFEQAKKFGVTQFVNPKDYSKLVQEVIAEMTDGGVDRSVECTGHIDAMIPAFECVHDDGDAEYSLLVNLKRLDDLQLSRLISIESLHNDLAATLYLKLWNNPGTIFIFLITKCSALFDLLESFLTTKSSEGLRASQLACRIYAMEAASRLMMDALISMHMELRRSYGLEESGCPQWIRWDKLELGSERTQLGGWLSYGIETYPVKAVLEKIVPASDNKKNITPQHKRSVGQIHPDYLLVLFSGRGAIFSEQSDYFHVPWNIDGNCVCSVGTSFKADVFEISKRDITISMMRNYPQLPHKFMSDKAKIHHLLEIIVHMNLERDSLKRQDQNFTSAVLLKKKAFKHGVKEALRSRVKALNFCATVSCGELQDFALNKFKGIEDELVIKLKSALKEVAVIGFLLLNMHLHICYCLHSIINSGSVLEQSISSFISKRSALFELLEFFLTTKSPEGLRASQLACCVISEQWWLFRKATFASTELEALGYSPDESILQKFWKLCERQLNIPGDSMFLFDRKDGHHWRKKKDGETVNETHEKMKGAGKLVAIGGVVYVFLIALFKISSKNMRLPVFNSYGFYL
ncbi:hypothetical protein KY290_007923 [Solanum tuberosum]|uniref:CG-1 domain-containing protein n=1 Tax=Solanum tuberosum TaxID=4113 RepID=A0ABQ7W6X6_SOLTU|nr:hypothetical protein KY290_007923 [Solanum tuberosum]